MENIQNHPLYKRHTIDTLIGTIISFFKSKFLVLYTLSFVISVLSVLFTTYALDMESLQSTTDPEELMAIISGMLWPIIGWSIVSVIIYTIMSYYIIYNPLDEEVTLGVAFTKSLRYLIPYLITLVLYIFAFSFASIIGVAALIIGVFFTTLYMLVIYLFLLPTFLVEGPDIGNAISKSFRRAHDGFWSNMGWVAVVVLVYFVVSLCLSSIISIPFAGQMIKSIFNPELAGEVTTYTSSPIFMFLSAASSALLTPVFPILGVILYFNGRAKEEKLASKYTTDNQID